MLPETITVEVTQNDIENGSPHCPYTCPVARAVSGMFPDYRVAVTYHRVRLFMIGEGGVYYRVPIEATNFMLELDKKRKVNPVTFTMTQEGKK